MTNCCYSTKITYSIPMSDPHSIEGESPIYREPSALKGLRGPPAGTDTMQAIILRRVKQSPKSRFLGQRGITNSGKSRNGSYLWSTHSEIHKASLEIGSAIIHLKLAPLLQEYKNIEVQFIGIFAKNSPEWVILDQACCLFGLTTVPVFETLGEEGLLHILRITNLTTLFLNESYLPGILKAAKEKKTGSLQNLVLIGTQDKATLDSILETGLTGCFWETLQKVGQEHLYPIKKVEPKDIFSLCCTIGTTGLPKAAMISHGAMAAVIHSSLTRVNTKENSERHLSYLPLAHMFERVVLSGCYFIGGVYAFSRLNSRLLVEDMNEIAPTMFVAVPKILNGFYSEIKEKLGGIKGLKGKMISRAIETKLRNLVQFGECKHWLYDQLVFKSIQREFGGKLKWMCTGSAPISKDVLDFLKVVFSCPIYEVYGQTEGSGLGTCTFMHDSWTGSVGGPLPCLEIKLVDLPEMNYFSKDRDSKGRLMPRGEIYFRGFNVFSGYYKEPEKTEETIDSQGWVHSGDVGQIEGDTGALRIIDRAKPIFKLSHGEYIPPEKLEQLYSQIKGAKEVFIYGNSLHSSIVAIIVPEKDIRCEVASWLGSAKEEVSERQIRDYFLGRIASLGQTAKVAPYEIPKGVFIDESVPSMKSLNLFTQMGQLKRHAAGKHYFKEIEALYSEIANKSKVLR